MVRKIGFDQKDTEAKKSIADSYLDEFRNKRKPTSAPPKPVKRKRNVFLILFLSVWLVFWSFGILTVIGIIAMGDGKPFLFIWLAAAVFGWLVATGVLINQIRGVPVKDDTNE